MFGISTPVIIGFLSISIAILIVVILFMAYGHILILYARFAYPNAKSSAIGNYFLNKDNLQDIVNTNNLDETIDKIYTFWCRDKGNERNKKKDLSSIERDVRYAYIRTIEEIVKYIPDDTRVFFDTFIIDIEIEQLKTIIRKIITKNSDRLSHEIIPVGIFTRDRIEKIVKSRKVAELGEQLKDRPYSYVFVDKNIEPDGKIYYELDKAYFNIIANSKNKVNSLLISPISMFVEEYIDITNLKIILRGKRDNLPSVEIQQMLVGVGSVLSKWKLHEMTESESVSEIINSLENTKYGNILKSAYEEYTTTNDLYRLEYALDMYFLRWVYGIANMHAVSIGPVLRFLIGRKYEMKNIFTLLKGISEGVSKENIMSMLYMV